MIGKPHIPGKSKSPGGLNKSGVYIIRCVPTGELYVGATSNFRTRFSSHRSKLRARGHNASRMQEAWVIYGEDAFEFIPLKEFPVEELDRREREAIDKLKPTFNTCFSQPLLRHTQYMAYSVMTYREKSGIPLTDPICRRKSARYSIRGEDLLPAEISDKYNIPMSRVMDRIYRGERGERIIRSRSARG